MITLKKQVFIRFRLIAAIMLAIFINVTYCLGQGNAPVKKGLFDNCPDTFVVSDGCSCDMEHQKKIGAGTIALQFKSNGQLTSYPPEYLPFNAKIMASIQLDDHFWLSRINEVVSNRIKTLETLNKYFSIDQPLTFGIGAEKEELKSEIINDLWYYVDKLPTGLLTSEQRNFYKKKVESYHIGIKKPVYPLKYVPPIAELINPEIRLYYSYYNKSGVRINADGSLYCNGPADYVTFASCCGCDGAGGHYDSPHIPMPATDDKVYEVRYELRITNNLNKATMAWKPCINYPEGINVTIESVKNLLNDEFDKNYKKITSDYSKIVADPHASDGDLQDLDKRLTDMRNSLEVPINKLNQAVNMPWFMAWLWLNNGTPKINPFDAKSALFASPDKSKLTPEDKARYALFDNMVTKGALKIEDMDQLDTGYKNLTRIRAAMDAEKAAQGVDPALYDRLLYQGILKISPSEGQIFMRHLDVANNYLIMAVRPKKEIDETNKLYILAENVKPDLKLSVGFTTAAPPEDNSAFTNALGGTADFGVTVNNNAHHLVGGLSDAERATILARIKDNFKHVKLEVTALKGLTQPPVLPVFFNRDETPDFITQVLEHNDLFDPPVVATYTVKSTATDNTQKDVNTGSYRINKLYRFRFKAGLSYSFLREKQYTLVSPGQYTESDAPFGVDGTFGIQTYFTKQDLRSKNVAWRPFFYAGLSMRKITENFYTGLGVEPLSGLAFGVNAHIGKMQALTGANGVPSSITDAWGANVAFSIMIDGALFVKLFSFGSSNKSLGGF